MSRTLVTERFEVPVDLDQAWDGLAQVQRWPEWAPHIRRVELQPAGALNPNSVGTFTLRGAPKTNFTVTEWDPPRSWTWEGSLLGMVLVYRHRFDPARAAATTLTWEVEGVASTLVLATVGRSFAVVYRRNLRRAVPRLVDWYRSQNR